MCGIVGYIGDKSAREVVVEGLHRLEYRGYDSAGVAVINGDGRIDIRREVGKLSRLRKLLEEKPVDGHIGIGHTRWATHGRPSAYNAHPHTDCDGDIVLVHNGIVENFLDLRRELEAKGHVFRSETDTEVIVHLVEEYLEETADLERAVRRALNRLRGAHGIVVMSSREPDKLIAARIGNAGGVTIGLGDGEMFVASDIPAILEHTRRMVFLESREMAVVTRDGFRVTTLDGKPLEKEVHK
jgi:glucosamine--fructose-6-phosphate aminotransferase (isomerizing)